MPELAEVETIRRQLEKEVKGKKIRDVVIKDKRIIKGISAGEFAARIKGKTLKEFLRRGKVLIVKLEDELFLIVHLRISGWILVSRGEEKFSRVILDLSDGRKIHFCDQRVLGELKLIDDWQKLPIIKTMGPDPLSISKREFIQMFSGKKTKIKPLLMDQSFLAGVGNVYAQESLFCAGIHPERNTDTLTPEELARLYTCLKDILKEAIRRQGSSVDTYRQIDGREGNYVPLLKVYQREGTPCVRCKTLIVRKTIGGRGTYFCPGCQK